jgi:methionyl-tRNA synthetase
LVCPDHLKPCEHIEEENYFFKLTAFENFLKDFYKNNPEFVTPASRFNEVKSFVEQ